MFFQTRSAKTIVFDETRQGFKSFGESRNFYFL